MKLNLITKLKNRKYSAKRVGRGYGSGKGGHTTGRGTKGQKSRTGGKVRASFAGGQNPLYKSLPLYRGFKSRNPREAAVHLDALEEKYTSGEIVTVASLRSRGLIRKTEKFVKVLDRGEIKKKLVLKGIKVSKKAQEKILKAGGEING